MKKPNRFLTRAVLVVADVTIVFNLGTEPKPPDLQTDPSAHAGNAVQSAKHEQVNVLPTWRNRVRELGYQLREPVSAEYRTRVDANGVPHSAPPADRKARDSHEQALAQQLGRCPSRHAGPRDEQTRDRQSGHQSRTARG